MKIERQILDEYVSRHTGAVLSVMEHFQTEDIIDMLQTISPESAALLIAQMDRFKAKHCLEQINLPLAAKIIGLLPKPNAEIVLRIVSEEYFNSILGKLPKKSSQSLGRIIRYPLNSIGAYLNPVVFSAPDEYSVKRVLEKIKKEKPQLPSHCYVVNRNQMLVGYIELNKLIASDRQIQLNTLMNTDLPKIVATSDVSSLADFESWIGYPAEIPIVDQKGIFLGILSKEVVKQIYPDSAAIDKYVYKTAQSMGELYKIGLVSFMQVASEIGKKQNSNN